MSPIRGALEGVAALPAVRALRRVWYETRFAAATGTVRLFRGVYPSFDAAIATVPRSRAIGFDNTGAVERLAGDRHRIFPSDYPILYWLTRLLPDLRLLFDLGGNVGISYFAYRPYLKYPDGFTWLVCDVPAAVALGERLAGEAGPAACSLHFTTNATPPDDTDLVLAAASLQFLEDPLGWLRAGRHRPRRILVNKAPLTDRPSAVTLHAIGPSFCAYHLFNRDEFIGWFRDLGYRVADEWTNADVGCDIPFHPEYRIAGYTGMLLERGDEPS